jgi:DnaJ-class molecular chaperone
MWAYILATTLGVLLGTSSSASANYNTNTNTNKTHSKTHYDVLNLNKDCSLKEIKRNYRKLALQYHPDKIQYRSSNTTQKFNNSIDDLKKIFLDIQDAYAVLSSATRRLQYDLLIAGFEYEDYTEPEVENRYMFPNRPYRFYASTSTYKILFTTKFSQSNIPDIKVDIKVTFNDVLNGLNGRIQNFHRKDLCYSCKGTGSKNGEIITCTYCNGLGQATHIFNNNSNKYKQMSNTSCALCNGRGFHIKTKCNICSGKGVIINENILTIHLNSGFDIEQNINVANAGHVNRDGRIGNVIANIKLELPMNWNIATATSTSEKLLVHTMKVPLNEIIHGFNTTFNTLYTSSSSSSSELEVEVLEIVQPDLYSFLNHNYNHNHNHKRNQEQQQQQEEVVQEGGEDIGSYILKLIQGFDKEFPNMGLLHGVKRGNLIAHIQCDFSQLNAKEIVELLVTNNIIKPFDNIFMKTTNNDRDDGDGDNKVNSNLIKDILRDYDLLLNHLISVRREYQVQDSTLFELLEMYSSAMIFVGNDLETELESENTSNNNNDGEDNDDDDDDDDDDDNENNEYDDSNNANNINNNTSSVNDKESGISSMKLDEFDFEVSPDDISFII